MPKVTLITEGKSFPVGLEVIRVSTYIDNLVKNVSIDNSDSESDEDTNIHEIPIQEVKAPILEKVLQWCNHYYDVHKYDIDSGNGNNNDNDDDHDHDNDDDHDHDNDDDDDDNDLLPVLLDSWEREFLDTDSKTIQQIIMAANYLNIKPLLQVSCKYVAELVRGRSPQEIIEAFNAVQSSHTGNNTDINQII